MLDHFVMGLMLLGCMLCVIVLMQIKFTESSFYLYNDGSPSSKTLFQKKMYRVLLRGRHITWKKLTPFETGSLIFAVLAVVAPILNHLSIARKKITFELPILRAEMKLKEYEASKLDQSGEVVKKAEKKAEKQ